MNIVKTLAPYMESSISRTAVQSKSAAKMSRAFSVDKTMGGAQSMDKPDATDQFTVEKHGLVDLCVFISKYHIAIVTR